MVVDLKKQQLTQAPGFTEHNWPDLDAAQKGQTVGLAPQQAETAGGTGSQAQQSQGATSGSITNLQQLSATADPSTFEGKPVKEVIVNFQPTGDTQGNGALGSTDADGRFTLMEVECLASCDTAPVMQVSNRSYYDNLTPEKVDQILDSLE